MVERFKSGQPLDKALSAAFLNDLSTMLEQWKRSQTGSIVGATPSTGERSQTVIRVKNVSGDTVPRFAVLGLGDPVIDPSAGDAQLLSFKNTTALQGDAPDIDTHWGKFCITLSPIPDGMIGEAVVSGVVTCKIDVQNSSHKFADVKDGEFSELKTNVRGIARILWKEDGTGTGKWACVCLDSQIGSGPFIGIAQEEIPPNTSGTFQFAYGIKGAEEADGTDVEGYYRTSSDSDPIPEDAVCYVMWINDGWELTPVECP